SGKVIEREATGAATSDSSVKLEATPPKPPMMKLVSAVREVAYDAVVFHEMVHKRTAAAKELELMLFNLIARKQPNAAHGRVGFKRDNAEHENGRSFAVGDG